MNKLVNEHYVKGKETTDWKIHLITDNFPKTSINSENPNLEEKQSNKDSPKPSPMKMYRWNEQMQGSSLALLPDICKFRYPDVIIQPIGADKLLNTKNKNWKRSETTGILTHHRWECKMVQTFWKAVCQLLTKLNKGYLTIITQQLHYLVPAWGW